ncbi:MAG TPA: hypothetical protein EYP19_13315, partial [Desulfobacterales bacterium]|nr:hypothetical protein [Desulfobacterales bacterium]
RGDGRDGKTGAVSRGTRGTNKKNGQGAVKAATTSSTIPRARLPDDFGEEDQDRLPGPDMPRPVARKPAQRLSILGWIEAKGDIGGIALAPDDSRIYVAYRGGPQGASIEEFLCETGKLLRRFPFPAPDCLQDDLAISNDGRYLFAANYYKDYVSRLDLTQNGLETRQKVHGSPQNVWAAFVQKSPDGIRLVVCAGEDGRVEDLDNDQISIYDIAGKNFKFLGKVILPDEPLVRSLGFTSDSSLVYVPTFRRKSAQDKLYEIRLTPPYEIARSISFPHAELASVVVHDPTRRIFLGDRLNKKIWVIDQEKLEVVSEISLQGRRVDAMELSPDGSVLYAISPTDRSLWAFDAYTLSEIEHLGGLRRDPKDIEISRDGARLFVAHGTDGGIAVIRGIKPCRGDGTILFSSDIHGNYQVFKLPTGSQEPVRLTRNFATELIPRWSPHGRLIAFISDRDGPFKIFLMDENGQNTKPLENTATSGSTEYGGIDWSPDGQQIAFIGQDQKSIRIVDVRDGSTSTILSGPIMGRYNHYAGISWKWDPERIVFGAFPAGNADSEEIFEVNIKSLKVSKVSGDEGQIGHYHMPALAPDKTTIAAERIITKPTGAEWDIVLFRGRGKKPFINLTMTPSRDALPRWSHDGKKIVFALQKTQRFHVWSMNADGTAAEPLTSGDANNIFPDIR